MCFSKLCWLSPQYYSAISASSFHTLLETIHGANMNGINQEGYAVDLKPPYDQASADWCHNKTHCTLLNCHLAGLTICLNMQPPPKWLSNWSLVGNGENLDWLGFGTAKNHNRNPFVIGGTYHTCRFSWTARPHVEDVLLPSLGYWGFRDSSVNAWSCSTVPALFLIVFSWGVLALCWCFEFAIASGLNSQKNSWHGI